MCVTRCAFRTLMAFTPWLARFTRGTWLTCSVGFLWRMFVGGVLMALLGTCSRVGVLGCTFFTRGAVATFAAVAAVTVA
jgi:hypothetical protein